MKRMVYPLSLMRRMLRSNCGDALTRQTRMGRRFDCSVNMSMICDGSV